MIKKSFHFLSCSKLRAQLKLNSLSDATFYDRINTIYQFIKPFLDKKCLFLRTMEPIPINILIGIDTLSRFSAPYDKGDNFHFLSAFLHTFFLLERCQLSTERICSKVQQILSCYIKPLFRRKAKTILSVISPESVSISFKICYFCP